MFRTQMTQCSSLTLMYRYEGQRAQVASWTETVIILHVIWVFRLKSGQGSTPSSDCVRAQIDTLDASLWQSPCSVNRTPAMTVKDIIKRMEELAANGKEDSSSAAAPSANKSNITSPRGSASTDENVNQASKGIATAMQQDPESLGPASATSAKESAAKPSPPEREPAVAMTPLTDPQQAPDASQPASGQPTQANGAHASAASKEPEDPEKKAKKVTGDCRLIQLSLLTRLAQTFRIGWGSTTGIAAYVTLRLSYATAHLHVGCKGKSKG